MPRAASGPPTIAAIHAIHLARQGRTVRLTTTVAAGVEDLAAVLGVPAPNPGEPIVVLPGLTLADHPARDVDNVVDGGTDCSSDRQGRCTSWCATSICPCVGR